MGWVALLIQLMIKLPELLQVIVSILRIIRDSDDKPKAVSDLKKHVDEFAACKASGTVGMPPELKD